MYRLLTNAKIGAAVGDVVSNAVPINALKNNASGVTGTYAMSAYATDGSRDFVVIVTVEQRNEEITGVETYDVTHSVNGRNKKRSEQVDTKSQGAYPSMLAAKISIPDLMLAVKETFRSVLPNV